MASKAKTAIGNLMLICWLVFGLWGSFALIMRGLGEFGSIAGALLPAMFLLSVAVLIVGRLIIARIVNEALPKRIFDHYVNEAFQETAGTITFTIKLDEMNTVNCDLNMHPNRENNAQDNTIATIFPKRHSFSGAEQTPVFVSRG